MVRGKRVLSSEAARLPVIPRSQLMAMEAGRDLSRKWIHVDMDAFYASCEELVNPALVRTCVIVCACAGGWVWCGVAAWRWVAREAQAA